jgi:uncharacterized protein YutE (UPF0331/DUF86 family)
MVDTNLVLRKLLQLERYLKEIEEFSDIKVKEYTNNWKIQRIVERTLQIMVETCLDIASHIVSDEQYRVPENYGDTFKVLLENKIIDEPLFLTMEKMVKFRNYIVHNYDKIDPPIVVSILKKNLIDFDSFKQAVVKYLALKKA